MNKEDNDISKNNIQLSEEILLKYINNELSDDENKRIELIIKGNKIYSDIIDGLLMLENPESIISERNELNKKIDAFSRNKQRILIYKYNKYRTIAALFLVCFVSVGVLLFVNKLEKEAKENNTAKLEKLQTYMPKADSKYKHIDEIDTIKDNNEILDKKKSIQPASEQNMYHIEELIVVEDEIAQISINNEASEQTDITSLNITSADIETEDEQIEPLSFAVVEEKPSFPGGDAALIKFIGENIVYPPISKESGITGKVFVKFVIDAEGKVTKVSIVKGIDPALNDEIIRVVKMMPDWIPGRQRGRNVPVSFILPVNIYFK
jgi:protein TonB